MTRFTHPIRNTLKNHPDGKKNCFWIAMGMGGVEFWISPSPLGKKPVVRIEPSSNSSSSCARDCSGPYFLIFFFKDTLGSSVFLSGLWRKPFKHLAVHTVLEIVEVSLPEHCDLAS